MLLRRTQDTGFKGKGLNPENPGWLNSIMMEQNHSSSLTLSSRLEFKSIK